MHIINRSTLLALVLGSFPVIARAQSFQVQCPPTTNLHPGACTGGRNAGQACKVIADCPDKAGTCLPLGSAVDANHPGQVKCQHIGGGDGYATMGDGHQIYLFAFSPLSGLADIEAGLPGTQTTDVFNAGYTGPNYSTQGIGAYTGGTNAGEDCRAVADCPDSTSAGVSCQTKPGTNVAASPNNAGIVEPAGIMDMGVLAGNAPAPLIAIDEDDELFLTLSNPGMIMRPDLFEQHTVHFHGYPNASSYFDGVPDASIAINIAGSFTYYYTAPDAGTYFWHCHITPPEHLQMGMVGQLYVRPRQNRVTSSQLLRDALVAANHKAAVDPLAAGLSCSDILCTGQTPVIGRAHV